VHITSGHDRIVDIGLAVETVRSELPHTASETPVTVVIDFGDLDMTSEALREIIVPIGQQLRGGVHGSHTSVVIRTAREALSEIIGLLAQAYDFPMYVTHDPDDVWGAWPTGDVTTSEVETLNQLRSLGGRASAAELAGSLGIAANAANNRLAGLERKGYIFRQHRGRREGDEYLDPRADLPDVDLLRRYAPKPMRSALLASGIDSDPYDTSDVLLEGESGERAAEILRRREKAH
jgi:hypothetical protein